eukprot:COSAG01_NODE_684_length_14252_cov_4.041617_4_plen_157_part_00
MEGGSVLPRGPSGAKSQICESEQRGDQEMQKSERERVVGAAGRNWEPNWAILSQIDPKITQMTQNDTKTGENTVCEDSNNQKRPKGRTMRRRGAKEIGPSARNLKMREIPLSIVLVRTLRTFRSPAHPRLFRPRTAPMQKRRVPPASPWHATSNEM